MGKEGWHGIYSEDKDEGAAGASVSGKRTPRKPGLFLRIVLDVLALITCAGLGGMVTAVAAILGSAWLLGRGAPEAAAGPVGDLARRDMQTVIAFGLGAAIGALASAVFILKSSRRRT
ncbi:MAG: hypothetical protein JXR37_28115 [Kiritimatiellae bacterium]|nr:hypothetical protein [Kiritimatiellia bacterium]